MARNLRIGVIGYGYWGPNIVRNFSGLEKTKVTTVCDLNRKALGRAHQAYPSLKVCCDCESIIDSPDIDAVAIVTPVSTHYTFAKKALQAGKHVFIEKPFTYKSDEAAELIELAERKNLTLMVDHTFLFTGAARKTKQLIDDGILGELYYFDSTRINLGLIQHDVNVIYDLAPHDLSIMDYLVRERPVAVSATGTAHFNNGLEDVAYITLYFASKMLGHVTVNWLSPVKVRTTLLGGREKMVVWDDTVSDEKIKVYDRGVDMEDKESFYDVRVSYRSGDMWAPKVDQAEALRAEAAYFLNCIKNQETPINDGCAGLRVVRLLEAATKSMKKRGEVVDVAH